MRKPQSFLRNVIGEYMSEIGELNNEVVVVNADLSGTCRNNGFVQKYPERSFNVGIAEQNMVSFAVGLAHEGFIPFVFSMAPFLTMRACEQCRTDVAYGKYNVRMIGTYAGVSGGISGATHWGIEDCAIMTSIPGITVLEASDKNHARCLINLTLEVEGPVYIRCGVEPVDDIYPENIDVMPGGSIEVTRGNDGAILCSGVIVQYALQAAENLKKKNISVRVVDMYSLKPIDRNAIIDAAKTGCVVVAQDHNIVGGLGSLVATVMAEEGLSSKFRIIGMNDQFVPMAHAGYLYHLFGLDAEGLEKNMLNLLGR